MRAVGRICVFLTCIREILVPQLWTGAIVVMDNLKEHHAALVKSPIKAVGAQVVFLSPYSPELSPIELCRSTLQPFLRSRSARTREALDQAMTDVMDYRKPVSRMPLRQNPRVISRRS